MTAQTSPRLAAVDDPGPDLESVTIKLGRPIEGHRGTIRELTFRPATFADWRDIGPVIRQLGHDNRAEAGGAIKIEVDEQPAKVMAWAVRLTNIPEAVLERLGPRDVAALKSVVLEIVAEFDVGNSPRVPTTSSSTSA